MVNVRLGSKYVSEYDNMFSPEVSKWLNDFLNFFSTINFSYQHLPEAKAYFELSQTSALEPFRKKIFFWKIHMKTPVSEFLFNKVTSLYPATSLNERTPTQVFSDEFCKYLTLIWVGGGNFTPPPLPPLPVGFPLITQRRQKL